MLESKLWPWYKTTTAITANVCNLNELVALTLSVEFKNAAHKIAGTPLAHEGQCH